MFPFYIHFPCGSAGKESACNAGDMGLIPELGRSSGERKGYPLQYSGLENFMDCIVHGVAKSQTQLSDFHFHSFFFSQSFFFFFNFLTLQYCIGLAIYYCKTIHVIQMKVKIHFYQPLILIPNSFQSPSRTMIVSSLVLYFWKFLCK